MASYYKAIVVGVYISTDPSESRSISQPLWAWQCQDLVNEDAEGYTGTWLKSLTHSLLLLLLFLLTHTQNSKRVHTETHTVVPFTTLCRVIPVQTRKEKPGGWKGRMDGMMERASRTKDVWMTVGTAQWG